MSHQTRLALNCPESLERRFALSYGTPFEYESAAIAAPSDWSYLVGSPFVYSQVAEWEPSGQRDYAYFLRQNLPETLVGETPEALGMPSEDAAVTHLGNLVDTFGFQKHETAKSFQVSVRSNFQDVDGPTAIVLSNDAYSVWQDPISRGLSLATLTLTSLAGTKAIAVSIQVSDQVAHLRLLEQRPTAGQTIPITRYDLVELSSTTIPWSVSSGGSHVMSVRYSLEEARVLSVTLDSADVWRVALPSSIAEMFGDAVHVFISDAHPDSHMLGNSGLQAGHRILEWSLDVPLDRVELNSVVQFPTTSHVSQPSVRPAEDVPSIELQSSALLAPKGELRENVTLNGDWIVQTRQPQRPVPAIADGDQLPVRTPDVPHAEVRHSATVENAPAKAAKDGMTDVDSSYPATVISKDAAFATLGAVVGATSRIPFALSMLPGRVRQAVLPDNNQPPMCRGGLKSLDLRPSAVDDKSRNRRGKKRPDDDGVVPVNDECEPPEVDDRWFVFLSDLRDLVRTLFSNTQM